MATRAVETRTNRVVVLMSDSEKRRISEIARGADMSVGEWMRTAAQGHAEPSEIERKLMAELLATLEEANARTDEALAVLQETERRAAAFDEDAYRAQVRAELEARDDLDWSAMAAFLGLARA